MRFTKLKIAKNLIKKINVKKKNTVDINRKIGNK